MHDRLPLYLVIRGVSEMYRIWIYMYIIKQAYCLFQFTHSQDAKRNPICHCNMENKYNVTITRRKQKLNMWWFMICMNTMVSTICIVYISNSLALSLLFQWVLQLKAFIVFLGIIHVRRQVRLVLHVRLSTNIDCNTMKISLNIKICQIYHWVVFAS